MEAFSPHFDYPTYSQGLFNPSTTPSIHCVINQTRVKYPKATKGNTSTQKNNMVTTGSIRLNVIFRLFFENYSNNSSQKEGS